MSLPKNFSPELEVVSYDGGFESEDLKVENILNTEQNFHCSGEGKGFSLILKSKIPIYVTNAIVMGPPHCTAPLKFGAIFVSESEKFDYADKFKSCKSKEEFVKLSEENKIRGGFFECSLSFCQSMVFFDPPMVGSYIHFLLIEPLDKTNIDVARLSVLGYESEQEDYTIYKKVGEIPLEMKVNRVDPSDMLLMWSEGEKAITEVISKKTVIFMGSNNIDDHQALKDIFAKEEFSSAGFVWTIFSWAEDTQGMMSRILDLFRLNEEDGSRTRVFALEKVETKYYFGADKSVKDDLLPWLEQLKAGTAPANYMSAPRPVGDMDPSHAGLTLLTRESFFEIGLDKSKDVFLDVYADWCGPCRKLAPVIVDVAKVLADVPEVVIAKLDVDTNDVPREYFPETSIPNMKFFPQDRKESPLSYTSGRTGLEFIKFIHEHSVHKFDLEEKVKDIKSLDVIRPVAKNLEELIEKTKKKLEGAREGFDGERYEGGAKVEEWLEGMARVLEGGRDVEAMKKYVEDTPPEEVKKELFEMMGYTERNKLKYVRKVRTKEEYYAAKKDGSFNLVVVDYFATWCGPCVYVAPKFAVLSVAYKDKGVLFVKVQEDELKDIIIEEKVGCYPTFKFFKKGIEVGKVEGGMVDEIKKLINENL